MKNKLAFFFLLLCLKALAQAPQSFSYQAIARDKDQKPLANASLMVEANILRNNQAIFKENHSAQTSGTGLFTLDIGSINTLAFQSINWALGGFSLQIKVSGDVNINVPAEPIQSVPYALYAAQTDPASIRLTLDGNTLGIEGGNSVVLPSNSGSTSLTTNGQGLFLGGNATSGYVLQNTGDTNPSDDLTTSSTAGGDVSGLFQSLSVDKIKGQPLSSTPPQMGQILQWDGNIWKPTAAPAAGLSAIITDATLAGNGTAATPLQLARQNAQPNQVLKWNGSSWVPADDVAAAGSTGAVAVATTLTGDGSIGKPLNLAQQGAQTGQVLKWNGSAWAPAADETGSGSGNATTVTVTGNGLGITGNAAIGYMLRNTGDIDASDDVTITSQAGGDLSGIFANLQINNGAVTSTEIFDGSIGIQDFSNMGAQDGQVLKYNSSTSRWAPATISGSSQWTTDANGIYYPPSNSDGTVRVNNGFGAKLLEMGPSSKTIPTQYSAYGHNTAGSLATYGANGQMNVYLTHLITESGAPLPNNGAVSIYGAEGYRPYPDGNGSGRITINNNQGRELSSLTQTATGAGFIETVGPNGESNVVLTNLAGYPNNAYVAVKDGAGANQAGMLVDENGLGYIFADYFSASVKNFRMVHPNDESKEIWYACIEGPEVAAYERGTTTLVNGTAKVIFSEHFKAVADPGSMTVILTPLSDESQGMAVVGKTADGFFVKELFKGKGNYQFDWEVKCVRKGYENYQAVRPRNYTNQSAEIKRKELPIIGEMPKALMPTASPTVEPVLPIRH